MEKALSDNTVDAYLSDLDKLLAFLELEQLDVMDVTLEHLETFSAGLRDGESSAFAVENTFRHTLVFPFYGFGWLFGTIHYRAVGVSSIESICLMY